jgi:N-acetylmuramoyl-L-alanine amidase
MKRILLVLFCVSFFSGCSTLYIDRTYTAKSQDSRAQFLILHYTAIDHPTSLRVLTQQAVSSHYLVSDGANDVPENEKPVIYQLVDENRRAYHAGVSYWKGHTQLNASSIGIEIVNLGYRDTPEGRKYFDFPKAQMDLVVALVKKIVKEHNIAPERILGHSDIAPQRKNDPGPRFNWKRLADEGLIPWFDDTLVAQKKVAYEAELPNIEWFQKKLDQFGYAVPLNGEHDKATRAVITAFQLRFRPTNFDGKPDAETAAILDVMTSNASILKQAAELGIVHLKP